MFWKKNEPRTFDTMSVSYMGFDIETLQCLLTEYRSLSSILKNEEDPEVRKMHIKTLEMIQQCIYRETTPTILMAADAPFDHEDLLEELRQGGYDI